MAEKKITKKELFGRLLEINEVAHNEDLTNFINHEIELLNKKATKTGTTKTQKENEDIKTKIINALVEIAVPTTITDLQKNNEELAEYSNQKLSALLKQLVETKQVVKTTDKKKSYFSIAE